MWKFEANLLLMALKHIFHNISSAFSGTYQNRDQRILEVEEELFSNPKTPTYADDKQNLNSDMKNVAGDYNRALNEYKCSR